MKKQRYSVVRASMNEQVWENNNRIPNPEPPCEGVTRGEDMDNQAHWHIDLSAEELVEFLEQHRRVVVEFDVRTGRPFPAPLLTIYDSYIE